MKQKLYSLLLGITFLFMTTSPITAFAGDAEEETVGYWEQTGIIDKPVDESQVKKSDYNTNTWTYGQGSYGTKVLLLEVLLPKP